MSNLARLSFSIEQPLLDRLEKMVKDSRYENRSEFIRDLIRGQLVEKEWERNEEALGTVTLIYDHHARQLSDKLTDVQHDYHDAILATTHVHLDHHLCAEMIMVRGRAERIRSLADTLRRQKGVLHSTLSMSSTGRKLR
ncbi:MAG: nickel-responsive transcriptional regulator NikR [FCB group bacterium]|jgi:CopG family nickel-responsive transcriptional regulator|nr:nickel-responsive transcriptional regulator NikR [FCB group bacterium]